MTLPGGWQVGREATLEPFGRAEKSFQNWHAKHLAGKPTEGGRSGGLLPIPPPCLDCGAEASWVLVWKASRESLGSSFEASRGLLGTFWVPVGASFRHLGSFLGALGGLLAVSGVSLGRRARNLNQSSPLGPLFRPSWGPLGPSWGSRWAVLETLLGLPGKREKPETSTHSKTSIF